MEQTSTVNSLGYWDWVNSGKAWATKKLCFSSIVHQVQIQVQDLISSLGYIYTLFTFQPLTRTRSAVHPGLSTFSNMAWNLYLSIPRMDRVISPVCVNVCVSLLARTSTVSVQVLLAEHLPVPLMLYVWPALTSASSASIVCSKISADLARLSACDGG